MAPIYHFFVQWWERKQPKHEPDFRSLHAFLLIWLALWTGLTLYLIFH